jgi:hypothetical protein
MSAGYDIAWDELEDRAVVRPRPGHPSFWQLEEWHTDRAQDGIGDHVNGCAECREYLNALQSEREALIAAQPAAAFVRQLRARADRNTARARRSRSLFGVATAASFAVALGVIVTRPAALTGVADDESAVLGMALKGMGGVTVIRERGSVQSLHRGALDVIPGDRLRVQIAMKQPGAISAGVFTDTGQWFPLVEGRLPQGMTQLDATITVDAEPSGGRILFGSPDAVQAARRGDPAPGLQEVQLKWRAQP